MSSKAVLVIDFQNDYFPGGAFPLNKVEEAAAVAAKVIADAREKKIPVYFIQHISADPAKIPFFLPDTKGADISDTVKPLENEVIVKKSYPNSFAKTNLRDLLADAEITDLVIVGAMSQMCVEATTRAAADFGFKCTVIEDACACPAQEFNGVKVPAEHVHAVAMSALAFGYANVISSAEYFQ